MSKRDTMNNNLNMKILKATKWASITEIIAKLIIPITNMILARILAPEAFGVIATITMIISFADMFTDAGFQKYLIQHEFETDESKDMTINVAFWTNLVISLIILLIIIIFSEKIANSVGNQGLGNVIAISALQLPITSFSSIQMAIYRRDFEFKKLFAVRIVSVIIPFIITIPLALLGFSYWSLIIGNICGQLANAIILTIKSNWKPRLKYNFEVLKSMFSFSMWSLIESISIWLTTWIDAFIIGNALNNYYLGVYKTSLTMVNAIFMLVTAATTPILFSALSRVQEDENEFNRIFFNMQKAVAYLVLPMAVGIFIYSDLAVKILLGNKWEEAGQVIGSWALTSGIVIVLGHYASEVYRAKGKPKLSFLAQILHIIVLIPCCVILAEYSFSALVNGRALIRLQAVVIHLIFMKVIMGISVTRIFKNIQIPLLASLLMGIVGMSISKINTNIIWQIISIGICIVVYSGILLSISSSRNELKNFMENIKKKKSGEKKNERKYVLEGENK